MDRCHLLVFLASFIERHEALNGDQGRVVQELGSVPHEHNITVTQLPHVAQSPVPDCPSGLEILCTRR